MKHLWLEIDLQDFDLETVGFNFSVLNPDTKSKKSKSYIRMSLDELRVFVEALKLSTANINLAAPSNVTDKARFSLATALPYDKKFPREKTLKEEIAEEVAKAAKRYSDGVFAVRPNKEGDCSNPF